MACPLPQPGTLTDMRGPIHANNRGGAVFLALLLLCTAPLAALEDEIPLPGDESSDSKSPAKSKRAPQFSGYLEATARRESASGVYSPK